MTKENSSQVCDTSGTCTTKPHLVTKNDTPKMNQNKDIRLVYYFDALCGWCYGFKEVMNDVVQKYGQKTSIEVVSGGLFLPPRTGLINEVAPYIKAGAYKSVEQRTGILFGKPFLNSLFHDGNIEMDSWTPAIALCIVKKQKPHYAFQFSKRLLEAIYHDGVNPIDTNVIAQMATSIGFDKQQFILDMQSKYYKTAAKQEFHQYNHSGAQGMPTLMIQTKDTSIFISSGYTSFEQIDKKLTQVMRSLNE